MNFNETNYRIGKCLRERLEGDQSAASARLLELAEALERKLTTKLDKTPTVQLKKGS